MSAWEVLVPTSQEDLGFVPTLAMVEVGDAKGK